MSIEQVCLIVALNLLAGTFLAWQKRRHTSGAGNLVLLTMIFLGFAMIWRSLA